MPTYRRKSFLYLSIVFDFLSLLRSFDNDKHIFFTGVPRYALHRLPIVCRPYGTFLS